VIVWISVWFFIGVSGVVRPYGYHRRTHEGAALAAA
jgi:hypothetical protein